jgi:hypothetical protein
MPVADGFKGKNSPFVLITTLLPACGRRFSSSNVNVIGTLFGEPEAKTKPDTFKSGSPELIAYHVSPPLLLLNIPAP